MKYILRIPLVIFMLFVYIFIAIAILVTDILYLK